MCVSVTNRTVDQANIVGEAVVGGANEVSQATVEGVENVAASSGLMSQVRTRCRRGSFPFTHACTCFNVQTQMKTWLVCVSPAFPLVGGACL